MAASPSSFTTLISADELAAVIDHVVLFDCRYELSDHAAGRRAYDEAHIPSARFLDMESELSGPKTGRNGRHPLPERSRLLALLAAHGVSDETQIVAYDSHGGAIAGRLWALARWVGHRNVAVLDGDLRAWRKAGFPVTAEVPAPAQAGRLSADRPALITLMSADEVMARLDDRQHNQVVDARAPERFTGAVEPIDPVGGHIPGALNRPFSGNLRPDGRYKPAEVLRDEFEALLAGRPPESFVHQCGSGVTACHNLLAMEHAGLTGSRLYPGSWSEWGSDPNRPVATGNA